MCEKFDGAYDFLIIESDYNWVARIMPMID
jgi:hypothetical protein